MPTSKRFGAKAYSYADAYRLDNPDRKFLWSRTWREKLRPMQLEKRPLCEYCRLVGKVTKAQEVDHIRRPGGDWALQRDPENFRSLCGTCHKAKTNWESRGDRKKYIELRDAEGWFVRIDPLRGEVIS
jgi:5-methylcytosine-specific restriction protein A